MEFDGFFTEPRLFLSFPINTFSPDILKNLLPPSLLSQTIVLSGRAFAEGACARVRDFQAACGRDDCRRNGLHPRRNGAPRQ